MTNEKLKEIESRLSLISRGPWFISKCGDNVFDVCCGTKGDPSDTYSIIDRYEFEDYNFMANARQDIPALIKEIRELQSVLNYINGE